jgi:hypothetical protein
VRRMQNVVDHFRSAMLRQRGRSIVMARID